MIDCLEHYLLNMIDILHSGVFTNNKIKRQLINENTFRLMKLPDINAHEDLPLIAKAIQDSRDHSAEYRICFLEIFIWNLLTTPYRDFKVIHKQLLVAEYLKLNPLISKVPSVCNALIQGVRVEDRDYLLKITTKV